MSLLTLAEKNRATRWQSAKDWLRADGFDCDDLEMPERIPSVKMLERWKWIKAWLAENQPATVRGVGYACFGDQTSPAHILSMSLKGKNETDKVSDWIAEARWFRYIPWEWIVENVVNDLEWNIYRSRADYRRTSPDYTINPWRDQPHVVEVWSEKSTRLGIIRPVLFEYRVEFHGNRGVAPLTFVKDAADRIEGRMADHGQKTIILYVGDWDPSGRSMIERGLRNTLDRLGVQSAVLQTEVGWHMPGDMTRFAGFSFPASDKSEDASYEWFVGRYGGRCWEMDAIPPLLLRARVKAAIEACIDDPAAWDAIKIEQARDRERLDAALAQWEGGKIAASRSKPRREQP